MAIKTCPICKKQFNALANAKYCSDICREKGNEQTRTAWEKKAGYREAQRKKRAEFRERKRMEEEKIRQDRIVEMEKAHAERLKAEREELLRKADAGDYDALMKLAHERGDMIEYYRLYALQEISKKEEDESDLLTLVNGISIYDPDFAVKVLDSIEYLGYRKIEYVKAFT